MQREQKIDFIINVLFALCVAGVVFFSIRYVLRWALPLVLGLGIAVLAHPIATRLNKRMRFKPRVAAVFASLGFYMALLLVLWFVGLLLYFQAASLVSQIPTIYEQSIKPLAENFNSWLLRYLSRLSPDATQEIDRFLTALSSSMESALWSLSSSAIKYLTNSVKGLPLATITIIFTVIISIIISMDYTRVMSFISRQLTGRTKAAILDSKNFMLLSMGRLLRAYVIILFITFVELAFGLWLLRVDYFITIAAITALLDILPVLGTGAVLGTWSVLELIGGNIPLALGLLILWSFITVVRNIIEPRIVGDQIGLHPLATIASMYCGLKIGGLAGLMAGPLTMLLLVHLNRNGHIKLFK